MCWPFNKKKKKEVIMEEQQVFNLCGFKESVLDGTEHKFSTSLEEPIPSSYSYKRFMPEVINQGQYPICVPCSISAFLNWRENLETGKVKDNGIKYFDIYNCKTTPGDGMSFKEALSYIRHNGVESNNGKLHINEYAMVTNMLLLKYAIVMNGPCVGALPVYNYSREFWKKNKGDNLLGYHAISIIGYDEEGFIIRNSWGESFGIMGNTKLKNEDFGQFLELWCCL